MPNEELVQRGYLSSGELKGDAFGTLEILDIGATTIAELMSSGLEAIVPASVTFPFTEYSAPRSPTGAKPDRVYLRRTGSRPIPVAVSEYKAPREFNTEKLVHKAEEQALHNGLALGVRVAIATDGSIFRYIDVDSSRLAGQIHYFQEHRDLNTGQKTCIVVLEKRHTPVDPRPDVFCAVARSIGETLNYERIPTPEDNDLDDIAESFIALQSGDPTIAESSAVTKLVSADQFSVDDRWDVLRFWSDEEQIKLGYKEPPVERLDFIDTTRATLEELSAELAAAEKELIDLQGSSNAITLSLSDGDWFKVYSGTRITNEQVRNNPGDIPVYSCFREPSLTKGSIAESWLQANNIPIHDTPFLAVNANGASVGKVFARRDRCTVTDDVIVVELKNSAVDLEYAATALRRAIAAGGFLYEAKLFQTRLKQLTAEIPVLEDGMPDISRQRMIASAIKRFDAICESLADLGKLSDSARIV